MAEQEQIALRADIVERLRADLLGPSSENEVLVEDRNTGEGDSPLGRYLVGVLFPSNSLVEPDEDDFSERTADNEEDGEQEATVPIVGMPKPSSLGLSFAVNRLVSELVVEFRYGVYVRSELPADPAPVDGSQRRRPVIAWSRTPIHERSTIDLTRDGLRSIDLPHGARGEWLVRSDSQSKSITVFLRNTNPASCEHDESQACLFQAGVTVSGQDGSRPFLNRADQEGDASYDQDVQTYRLLYRDKPEFAVGHGCAAGWTIEEQSDGHASAVHTTTIPDYIVTATEARGGAELNLAMEELGDCNTPSGVIDRLSPLLEQYREWIAARRLDIDRLPSSVRSKASEHLTDCEEAYRRMSDGLSLLAADPLVFGSFKFANRVMALQRRRSVEALNYQTRGTRTYTGQPPAWRPFQIAFILLNIRGIASAHSPDRAVVDLLWFPTGGGKTEAYLGLAAFTIALRRMRHCASPSQNASGDGGVTVLMRYTLRLLTIQQFQRAATLICACETLRRQQSDTLGREPFSIGLWVGGAATPNHIDQQPDAQFNREAGALQALSNFDPANEPDEGNPVQLRSCPWCGEALAHTDYHAYREFKHLQIRCPNTECAFHGSATDIMSGIPAFLVDEDIYLRCPTLLIGTVDKIARLPWDDRTKSLFGRIDRHCERHGYLAEGVQYQECGGRHRSSGSFPATGQARPVQPFLPPELIIQDELHLATGPLGSLMGLYEAAVDLMSCRDESRPKVIASTATIRRFHDQIRSVFDRDARQFPPPGIIAGDSFFAAETSEKPGRMYLGVCAPGRSMKTAALRVLASLMHSSECARQRLPAADVDPYWTVVNYFNSLRELGGAIRLIDDDVDHRLRYLARLAGMPGRRPERRVELTSRIPAKLIPQRLREMERTLDTGEALDVLLATNMISVGVDIQRFGLMMVTGQPKTSAEYIQATSRVGRQTPGLVLILYNWSRPRDLSHYERFLTFHSMLYRHVEASSVTPFSARARDKAFHCIFFALVRLLDRRMAGNDGAQFFNPTSEAVARVRDFLLSRISDVDEDELADARDRLQELIDGWREQQARHGTALKYRAPGSDRPPKTWLMQSAEEARVGEFPKPTLNSLREVEKASGLYFKRLRRGNDQR